LDVWLSEILVSVGEVVAQGRLVTLLTDVINVETRVQRVAKDGLHQ